MQSIREDPNFVAAIEQADDFFRRAFAALLTAGIEAAGNPKDKDVNDRIRPNLSQGNARAVRDAARGAGWVDTDYAEALFKILELPNATHLAAGYREIKSAVDGRTETWYRNRAKAKKTAGQ